MKKYNSKDVKRIINSTQDHALSCTLESVQLALEDANCDSDTRSKIMKSRHLTRFNIEKKIKDKKLIFILLIFSKYPAIKRANPKPSDK